jgi:hypothetical protein
VNLLTKESNWGNKVATIRVYPPISDPGVTNHMIEIDFGKKRILLMTQGGRDSEKIVSVDEFYVFNPQGHP